MSNKFQFDVFLSYKSDDRPRVARLAERLRDAGLRVWFDEWIIKPGADIYLTIERGLASTRTLVLCMSPAAFGSDWVDTERSTVLFRDPTNDARTFIPLLLTDCEIPDTLRRFKYIDYRNDSAAAFKDLLEACRSEAEAPPVKKPASKKKVKPEKAVEQSEPLAVLERTLIGHENWVRGVAVNPDGTWLASGSFDGTVKIWRSTRANAEPPWQAIPIRCSALCLPPTADKSYPHQMTGQF